MPQSWYFIQAKRNLIWIPDIPAVMERAQTSESQVDKGELLPSVTYQLCDLGGGI